ncbi:TPA: helix-turn-helix transcriptional regulator, partial [Escherichia coli]
TENCTIDFYLSNKSISCGKNQFIFIDKGTFFSASLRKFDKRKEPYTAIRFNSDKLRILRQLIVVLYFKDNQKINYTTISNDKILTIASTNELVFFFKRLSITNDEIITLINSLLFISNFKNRDHIIHSIIASSICHFSDKVRALIETNLNRKWSVQDMAKFFHLSESATRKRLAKEKTSLKKIILQTRLNSSIELIIENELQISQISSEVGVSSTSYFIKKFKEYFGITPKKLRDYFVTQKNIS